jgi:ABC-type polysaccharide/polyol phosphate transport system ATPase subunit
MPVGTYSTGMRGRLGFAVSTALEPDILLLDEVLAAGDLGWRQRCFRRLDELNQDTTLVLVTHLPTHIQRVCNRVIWLHEGRVRADGPTDEVLGEYAEAMARIHAEYVGEHGGGALEIEEDWV